MLWKILILYLQNKKAIIFAIHLTEYSSQKSPIGWQGVYMPSSGLCFISRQPPASGHDNYIIIAANGGMGLKRWGNSVSIARFAFNP